MKVKATRLLYAPIILFLYCMLPAMVYGQSKGVFKKIYLQGGLGFANYSGGGGEIGLQSVMERNWIASISYQHIAADPKNLPGDYEPDYIIFFPVYPTVNMDLFNFTGGKMLALGKNIWITMEAGITIGSGETMTFTPRDPQFFFIGATSNYETETKKKSLTGLMLKTDFSWCLTSFMGLGAGLYANINSIQSPVGANIKLLVGKTGRRKKHDR